MMMMMTMIMIINMIISILCFIIFSPIKRFITLVLCQNYSKFSYIYAFKGQIFFFLNLNDFLGVFHYFGPYFFVVASLPLSSQYLDLIIRCASLEQLMGALSHFFFLREIFFMLMMMHI